MDEPAAADRVGAQVGGLLQLGVLVGETVQQVAHDVEVAGRRHGHPATAAWSDAPTTSGSSAIGSQRPDFIER